MKNFHTASAYSRGRIINRKMTKINVGLAYTNKRFYYHAWCSVFIGKWVDMDPTFGQNIADVGHIKLIEGDLNKQLDIIKVLGRIKVEVIKKK